ncbi:MAG: hypothetical protein ACLPVF_00085 [Acidimicrobiales bacterium]
MHDAPSSRAAGRSGAGEGRYARRSRLGRVGDIEVFTATDRWLRRIVGVAVAPATSTGLRETAHAVGRLRSPHVVEVYDRGVVGDEAFVVFEWPAPLLAIVATEAARLAWDEARAVTAAKECLVGLSHLHRVGVETSGLHLDAIGIDASGRIRVSPWPLVDATRSGRQSSPSGPGSANELALIAAVLDTAATPEGSPAAALASRLRRPTGRGVPPSPSALLATLSALELASRSALEATAERDSTGETPLVDDAPSGPRIYRRTKRRSRGLMAAGTTVVALAVFAFLIFESLAGPPPKGAGSGPTPAACSTKAGSCAGSGTSTATTATAGTAATPSTTSTSVAPTTTSSTTTSVPPTAATTSTSTTTTPSTTSTTTSTSTTTTTSTTVPTSP